MAYSLGRKVMQFLWLRARHRIMINIEILADNKKNLKRDRVPKLITYTGILLKQ